MCRNYRFFPVLVLLASIFGNSAIAQSSEEAINRRVQDIASTIKQNPASGKEALLLIWNNNSDLPDSILGTIFMNLSLAFGVSDQLDSAKWAVDRAINYFDKTDIRKASSMKLKATFLRLGKEYKQSEAILRECLERNEKIWKNKHFQCEILSEYASLHLDQRDYFKATQLCLEAIKIIESPEYRGKDKIQTKTLLKVKLAEVNLLAGNDSMAIHYLIGTLPTLDSLKNLHLYMQAGYKLSEALIRTQQFNTADSLVNKLLPIARQLKNETYEASLLSNLGISRLKRSRHPDAISFFRQSFALMKKINSPFILVCVVPYLTSLKETGGREEAIQIINDTWVKKVLAETDDESKLNYQRIAIHFQWDEMNGNQLHDYYQNLLTLYDTVNREGDRQLALELQSKYQFEEQEKNKASLMRENDLLKKQTTYERNQNYLILALSIMALLAILQLTLRLRQRARLQSKRILIQEQEIEVQKQQAEWAEREKAYRDQLIEQQKIMLKQSITDSEELTEKLNQLVEEQKLEKRKEMLEQFEKSKEDDMGLEKMLMQFNLAHPTFVSTLHKAYPKLSHADLQYCILYRMNLSTKEISAILNMEPRSVYVKKYRLLDKMGLGKEDDFNKIIFEIG